jgi:hypothetical protein
METEHRRSNSARLSTPNALDRSLFECGNPVTGCLPWRRAAVLCDDPSDYRYVAAGSQVLELVDGSCTRTPDSTRIVVLILVSPEFVIGFCEEGRSKDTHKKRRKEGAKRLHSVDLHVGVRSRQTVVSRAANQHCGMVSGIHRWCWCFSVATVKCCWFGLDPCKRSHEEGSALLAQGSSGDALQHIAI